MTTPDEHRTLLLPLLRLAVEAGDGIMQVYRSGDFHEESKADDSPLTLADLRSHEILDAGLRALAPDIPILSEEGAHTSFAERTHWDELWLVDPLDGTKEFIQRNGEFTVNIALVQNGEPVLGVIYAPDRDDAWLGVSARPGGGSRQTDALSRAWKLEEASSLLRREASPGSIEELARPIRVCDRDPSRITIIASRTHLNEATRELIARVGDGYPEVNTINVGSSLKLCTLAEGLADLYPRYAPTSEWDIGAGHAIVRGAGGEIYQAGPDADAPSLTDGPACPTGGSATPESARRFGHTRVPLRYNKENLLNPWFVVRAWR